MKISCDKQMFSKTTVIFNPVLSSLVSQAMQRFLKMCQEKWLSVLKIKYFVQWDWSSCKLILDYGLLGYYKA